MPRHAASLCEDRHGSVRESATLGDIRALPLYGTGDQANGYPQSKWLAEVLVLEAARQGLPCYIHRPGLIGGHSVTGAAAEDVFFHFLADVLKLRRLPQMNGRKFNVTPVDWVAKAIARIALPGFLEEGKLPSGSVFHPAAPNNAITTNMLAAVLKRFGYGHLAFMDFVDWRDSIVGSPLDFKSWSFCAALSVEGDGIDSMAETMLGAKAIREAVGEAFDKYDPADCLVRMLRWYTAQGLLPQPESAWPDAA